MRLNLLLNFHNLKGLDNALNLVFGNGGGEEGEANQQKLLDNPFTFCVGAEFWLFLKHCSMLFSKFLN